MNRSDAASRRFGLPRSALARGALFLVLGGLLHFAMGLVGDARRGPEIVLTEADVLALERAFVERGGRPVDAPTRDRLIAQEIDDRLLVAEARRRGWHRSDPVVQRRLVQNQRFLGADPETSDATLLAHAYEQGMDETDIVVRRRLIERVRLAVAEAARREPIDPAELEAYLGSHAELFRRPARVDLTQVFLSRDRRGASLERDAAEIASRLSQQAPTTAEALAWADPSLLPQSLTGASEDEIARHFGPDFARAAHAAEVGVWTGPIPSTFGLHFVRVGLRSPAVDPPLFEVEAGVRARVQRDREDAALRRLLEQLRSEASIETPPAPA